MYFNSFVTFIEKPPKISLNINVFNYHCFKPLSSLLIYILAETTKYYKYNEPLNQVQQKVCSRDGLQKWSITNYHKDWEDNNAREI